MSTILTIAVHELRVMYRRSVFRILTLGLPIVALLALVVVWGVQSASKDEDQKIDKVGYVDGPELFTSHLAQGRLLFVAYASQEEGIEALLSEGVERLYVIPTDYLATGAVQRFDVGLGLNFDDGDDPGLRAFLLDNLSESAPDSDVIERLKQPVFLSRVALDPDGAPSSPSEDYLTVLAGQRQWIATTNFAGCPGRPPDSFANSAVLTTSAKFLMRWAGPSTRAFLCRLTPKRNSLSRLWPVQISDHSPFTFSSPRSRNCRNPRPCLIWPNTGSTVCIRKA